MTSDIVLPAIGLSIILPILLICFGLYLWNIILLIKHWEYLDSWAKILYILLLFTGFGPLPSLILLGLGVGILKKKKHIYQNQRG